MNLKSISDSELLVATKQLASEEKRIGIQVLHHLREIDARKLFASLGFSSLFSYCTGELQYSEGGAYRRIASMKLLRDVPEYESKLQEGAVSVATLSQVQSFFVQEKRQLGKTYTPGEKLELLAKVEGKSSQQTERLLAAISPQSAREERARVLNGEETEIRFTASRELMEKIERLKNLLGHKPEAQSYAGLIEELVDLGIKKLDPLKKSSEIKSSEMKRSQAAEIPLKEESAAGKPDSLLPPVEVEKSKRYVPAAIVQAVWRRDEGRCSFTDVKTGRRCESQHALQMEHIHPFGRGGGSSFENLKLLCPSHNQFAAIQVYGLTKMQKYWAK
jgi:hypothetical protein